MKPSPRTSRTPATLSESTHHHLNMYAVSATAASVGILALTVPAEAKIVYTPTHQVIDHTTSSYALDVNHDGITDFRFHFYEGSTSRHRQYAGLLAVPAAYGNVGEGKVGHHHGSYLDFALTRGRTIGPRDPFVGRALLAGFGSGIGQYGYWANVSRRYLGLKFMIHGKIHYGWARLNVTVNRFDVVGTLTGYAYETIPNKPIIAGKTKGPDDSTTEVPDASLTPASKPATLGMLALGAPALSIWRREELAGVAAATD